MGGRTGKGKTGEEKKVSKRKRMKTIFARFDYHTLMMQVVLSGKFRMIGQRQVPVPLCSHVQLISISAGLLQFPPNAIPAES